MTECPGSVRGDRKHPPVAGRTVVCLVLATCAGLAVGLLLQRVVLHEGVRLGEILPPGSFAMLILPLSVPAAYGVVYALGIVWLMGRIADPGSPLARASVGFSVAMALAVPVRALIWAGAGQGQLSPAVGLSVFSAGFLACVGILHRLNRA